MTRSISLSTEQRTHLLDRYRKDPDPEVRFRSHILLDQRQLEFPASDH
jgi:hypothetical protein